MSNEPTEEAPTHQDTLYDALAKVVHNDEGGLVSKWLCLVEVIQKDGNRAIWALASTDLAPWDQLGLIEFHSRVLHAHTHCHGNPDA